LALRADREAGRRRRVIAAARFSAPGSQEQLEKIGAETAVCDLLDREELARLPDCPNVIYMAGQKFGTSAAPSLTWAQNAYAPALAAERFRGARIVAFSTGNVYPLTAADSGGPTEKDRVGPLGEYAQSALARERIFEYFSERYSTPTALLRLNYAIDLRYGVLRDLADKVQRAEAIDLAMGRVNVIWQRDANSVALRAFAHCSAPPFVLNLTGPRTLRVREIAQKLGELLGREPRFTGVEAETALLSNARLCAELFSPETATVEEMIGWTAEWVRRGGVSLEKPTHFEQRDGVY
jgi:nucleoside-diphosphate-sugar epimerase